MKICFVVRSVGHLNLTQTTTHLAFEAAQRGHRVYFTSAKSFCFTGENEVAASVLKANSQAINRTEFLKALLTKARPEQLNLSRLDVVFLRYNASVGESNTGHSPYLEFARLLKNQGVMVINDPAGLSRAASKMYMCNFPQEIRPQTLISRNPLQIKDFLRDLKKPAIVKPLSGYGGQDVFFVKSTHDLNVNQIIAAVSKNGYVMAQEYLPEVRQGDKRLLLLNGSPIFAGERAAIYRRMSPKGEIRSNIHVGGIRKACRMTKADLLIAETVRPKLLADGLYFVGADIVGNKLLELNVFCPGGINNINELYGVNIGAAVIDDLEKRVRVQTTHRTPPHHAGQRLRGRDPDEKGATTVWRSI